MPNGGTDNCMNCRHNRANQPSANIKTALRASRVPFCAVHGVPVWDHAWTYCPNYSLDEPNPRLPIYANGLFEEGYERIAWLGLAEPIQKVSVKQCEVCGCSAERGLLLSVAKRNVRVEFCCNDHYQQWQSEQSAGDLGWDHWYVYDRSPLQQAILRCDDTAVEALLSQRDTINHPDRSGWTALHLAAYLGATKVVDWLLNVQADATLADVSGFKAIDLAGSEGHTAIVAKLVAASFIDQQAQEEALLAAATQGNIEVMEALVASGVDIECRDGRGRTPLLLTIWGNHYTASVFLLDHGADVRAQDKYGDTPQSMVDTWNKRQFSEMRQLVHAWLDR